MGTQSCLRLKWIWNHFDFGSDSKFGRHLPSQHWTNWRQADCPHLPRMPPCCCKWLSVSAEAIYASKPRRVWLAKNTESLRYVSKGSALLTFKPQNYLNHKGQRAGNLKWPSHLGKGLLTSLPVLPPSVLPVEFAWTVKLTGVEWSLEIKRRGTLTAVCCFYFFYIGPSLSETNFFPHPEMAFPRHLNQRNWVHYTNVSVDRMFEFHC